MVGQWTRLIASRRTCRTNSPGETLAMFLLCSFALRIEKRPADLCGPAGLRVT